MPTKSKWQLEAEKKAALLESFKKQVVQQVERCQEDYGLELCEDGLQDFFESLGIDYNTKSEGEIILRIRGVRAEVDKSPSSFHNGYRPTNYVQVENLLDNAASDMIDNLFDWTHPNLTIDVEFDF